MRIHILSAVSAVSLSVAGCTFDGGVENGGLFAVDTFCGRHAWVCVVGFVAAVGVISVAVCPECSDGATLSDQRLKRDVRPVGTLPNGLRLYAFRYFNDDRTFVSIMAQDLLEDARFRDAVTRSDGGYYLVNLKALGLGIVGDAAQFREAGLRALQAAEAAAD